MKRNAYEYRFDASVPTQDLEDTFLLALLAVESLYGRSRVRMESWFVLHLPQRIIVIDASTVVGSDLARIFTGFATKEYGDRAVTIHRGGSDEAEMNPTGISSQCRANTSCPICRPRRRPGWLA